MVFDARRGFIVTKSHLIDHADEITVKLIDGRTLPARRVGADPETDVAVRRQAAFGVMRALLDQLVSQLVSASTEMSCDVNQRRHVKRNANIPQRSGAGPMARAGRGAYWIEPARRSTLREWDGRRIDLDHGTLTTGVKRAVERAMAERDWQDADSHLQRSDCARHMPPS